MMEWTGTQQIVFLLQSAILGAAQGLILDVLTGFTPIVNHKSFLWVDIFFGPIAAVVTFCGALLIMDGQIHPILILGMFLGMVISHCLLGNFLCGTVRKVRFSFRKDGRHFWARLHRYMTSHDYEATDECKRGQIRRKKAKNS